MPVGLLYVLFFLSGAAALIYQLVWVRWLSLVFGGSHLAVTAVLSIFMAGLALGGYAIGRRADRVERPLRLYGWLEVGIAVFALVAAVLMRVYPSVYAAVARGRDDATLYLTAVRMLFSVVALIGPTILMGGTLPVVARFVAAQPERLRRHLSFLYAVNTLGAVVGALVAGFVLLRLYSVSVTFLVAVATNLAIGLVSLGLQVRHDRGVVADHPAPDLELPDRVAPVQSTGVSAASSARWVLWGIGLSGFCALGYEVLWTRVLAVAVGASVYGFTIILGSFLTGIGLGSQAYGLFARLLSKRVPATRTVVAWFGITQVLIGITALVVTVFLGQVPIYAVRLQHYFAGAGLVTFEARTWTSFVLAFLYMSVPALFMGAAFPLAGEAVAGYRRATGRAVGDVLAVNTVGAIVGAALSGLVLMHVFGIERSLQLLTVVNIGVGLIVLGGLSRGRWVPTVAALPVMAAIGYLALNPGAARVWDQRFLAIFRNNQPEAFRTPDMVREAVENTDVLYYAEGTEASVSVIRVKGGEQAFITNGRVEASSHTQAQQVQYTLGHLPVLLARDPKDVLVVGLGSGMTVGATSVHPSVASVTLVELEPQVLGVARTFEAYNHRVLDNPKLQIVFNDGRNFLTTTNRMFDVITADPIHPWFRGAGSLYASEYFALAARHLRPGGVIAQWLPIYELTPADLASVVKTFGQHFAHTMMWLTHYDAILVGSDAPFRIDEAELARRLAVPDVAADLTRVSMGSATEFLSYFVMGTEGMGRFSQSGTLNTDDRPYLEFSAPFSIATPAVMAANVDAISAQRESLVAYLKPSADAEARTAQENRWQEQLTAGKSGDKALALFLGRGVTDPDFGVALRQLNLEHPGYAPGRALWTEYQNAAAMEPRLLERASFHMIGDAGTAIVVELSAVLVPVSATRAAIMFVDNATRTIYGQAYMDDYSRDRRAEQFAADVMKALRAAYEQRVTPVGGQAANLPAARDMLQTLADVIQSKVKGAPRGS